MKRLLKNPLSLAGLVIVVILLLAALLAPVLAPFPDHALGGVNPVARFHPPDGTYWMGTDDLGRDIFSRVLYGARISVWTGVLAIGLALVLGVPLGAVAGTFGGAVDELIMRITDIFLSFPPLLLAIAIGAMLGPSLSNTMIAIALAWWPWYTRLIRGEATSVRERPFVEAARAAGVRPLVIVFRHILPNTIAPVIVQASMDFGSVVLTLASLSFLGLGAQVPTPEWGLMINTGRTYFVNAPWYVTYPGLAIFLTVLGFNLLGDGLREVLDPKGVKRSA
ncbi:MAG: binding-protein-dependent transport system inner rane component [Firmicutes bacterium]|nr:binding-protein-dependent transport system inner rane component [Bacillota bacterium]